MSKDEEWLKKLKNLTPEQAKNVEKTLKELSCSTKLQEETIRACANVLIGTIADIIYADSHQWSTRPCETCRVITAISGKSFGCDRYREYRKDEK